ncbi:MAG: HAD family phosphatase [Succinivibrionaceae bacterium]|nr:HAD family phosphatase [Succinivibrionaceae bacterium]
MQPLPTHDEILAHEGVIFDLDGTLIDSEPLHIRAWNAIAADIGIPERDLAWANRIGGISTIGIARLLIEEYGLKDADPAIIARRKTQTYIERFLPLVPAFPKTCALLIECHEAGRRVAVATGSQLRETEDLLQRHGLAAHVDAVVTSDQVKNPKPAPDTYLEAARRLGVDPGRCIAFEDTDLGLSGIAAAGMLGVKVRGGELVPRD